MVALHCARARPRIEPNRRLAQAKNVVGATTIAEICLVDPNTRQGKRTPVTLKIKFKSETLEQFIERYAIDVSQGGIFIRTKEPLAVGTQMKFEFQLRDASPLIAGEGTVVWTRENDPSRPAIAPGMGVRFDRLADGSQGILERILAEKAKQAPLRPQADTTKPPMFSDTPTRVAPAPIQEALLGKDNGQRGRRGDEPHNDSHTPLPRPVPFHSDADEFPDEAFEEATKVRALDELIAQTAEGGAAAEASARRGNGRPDSTLSDPASDRAETEPRYPQDGPTLPSPPEPGSRPVPRLLDTSPSPRIEAPQPSPPALTPVKTQLGVEPARARLSPPPPPLGQAPLEAPPLPSGMRAVATEHTEPARLPPMRGRSSAPIVILILALVAVGAAAVWFLVLRPQHTDQRAQAPAPAPTGSDAPPLPGPGSAQAPEGSAAVAAPPAAPEIVDTVIDASADGATVAVDGTSQSGPAPFTAKLEKGKSYKVRVSARGFLASDIEIKGGDDSQTVKLTAKPRVISINSEPRGALIIVDNATTGHTTPFDVELTPAQAAKKSVRVQLRRGGYRTYDRTIELDKLTEEDARMVHKLEGRLAVAPAVVAPPVQPSTGSEDVAPGTGSADAAQPGTGSGQSAPAPAPAPPPASGTGSAAEPEPAFNKQP
jgi:uncharacterized protein (TIGR02266 family)